MGRNEGGVWLVSGRQGPHSSGPWHVQYARPIGPQLKAITDERERAKINERIEELAANDPETAGRALAGRQFVGYRRVHTLGFRIIYRCNPQTRVLLVATILRRRAGNRDDVYEEFGRILDSGKL
jgi:mRNA-degrading endonuclease RelE of RelBE toxin-antitoxin system